MSSNLPDPSIVAPLAVPTATPLDYITTCDLPTPWATFRLHAFMDNETGKEHLAMALGAFDDGAPVLMRMHSECLTGDALFSQRALWLAGYVPEARLSVPKTWQRWTFWQYSDGSINSPRRIAGLPRCDQSWFAGDERALNQLCAGNSPEPPAAPEPGPNNAPPLATHFVWPRTPALAGPSVLAWQKRLLALGYEIDTDGVYGPQSKAACRAFQRNSGLVADGIVGPTTWNFTFSASVSPES